MGGLFKVFGDFFVNIVLDSVKNVVLDVDVFFDKKLVTGSFRYLGKVKDCGL
jgi:hypothetical protein